MIRAFWERVRQSGWLPLVLLLGSAQFTLLLMKRVLRLSGNPSLSEFARLAAALSVGSAFLCVAGIVLVTLFTCVYQFRRGMRLKACLNAFLVMIFGFFFIVLPVLFIFNPPSKASPGAAPHLKEPGLGRSGRSPSEMKRR